MQVLESEGFDALEGTYRRHWMHEGQTLNLASEHDRNEQVRSYVFDCPQTVFCVKMLGGVALACMIAAHQASCRHLCMCTGRCDSVWVHRVRLSQGQS